MDYKIQILKRAQIEIETAFDYFAEISHTALKNFNDELEISYERLKVNPKFQVRYKFFRVLPFPTFPYIIVFTVDEDNRLVKIYSVFNTYQDPAKYP